MGYLKLPGINLSGPGIYGVLGLPNGGTGSSTLGIYPDAVVYVNSTGTALSTSSAFTFNIVQGALTIETEKIYGESPYVILKNVDTTSGHTTLGFLFDSGGPYYSAQLTADYNNTMHYVALNHTFWTDGDLYSGSGFFNITTNGQTAIGLYGFAVNEQLFVNSTGYTMNGVTIKSNSFGYSFEGGHLKLINSYDYPVLKLTTYDGTHSNYDWGILAFTSSNTDPYVFHPDEAIIGEVDFCVDSSWAPGGSSDLRIGHIQCRYDQFDLQSCKIHFGVSMYGVAFNDAMTITAGGVGFFHTPNYSVVYTAFGAIIGANRGLLVIGSNNNGYYIRGADDVYWRCIDSAISGWDSTVALNIGCMDWEGATLQVYGESIRFLDCYGANRLAAIKKDGLSRGCLVLDGTEAIKGRLTLPAGSTPAKSAPIVFQSGSFMTTPEAGAMEASGDSLTYTTISTVGRRGIVLQNVTFTSGRVPFATTGGFLIDSADFTFSNSTGNIGAKGITITGSDAATKHAIIKAAASQSADILEIQNSAGSSLAYFNSNGALRGDWQAAGGKFYMGRLPVDANFGGLWFASNATSPAASNYAFLGDVNNCFLNGAVTCFLRIANTTKMQISSTAITVTDAINFVFGTTSGTKFGTGTTQKIGFFNATPIVQPSNTTDLRTALINLGLYASGGASPLDLNGGAFTTSGVVTASGTTDSTSNSTGIVLVSGGVGVAKSIFSGGDIACDIAGKGLKVKEGSNAKMGTATLTAGSIVVSTTAVTANSRIFLCSNADGGTPGWLRVSARTASTSFTITSSSGTDTSTVAWIIFEPS